MPTDPMAGYEQHEAEQAERHDNYRYENDWAEAVEIARVNFRRERAEIWYAPKDPNADNAFEYDLDASRYVLRSVGWVGGAIPELYAFAANHGTPALLRVLAQAIELETGK